MSTKGTRIKLIREKMNLTQQGFADILGGVSRGAVGNWERDQGIKEENIEAISDKTGVSYEWLATGRGSMDPNNVVAPPADALVAKQFRIPDLAIFGGMGGGGALSATEGVGGLPSNPDDLRGYWTFPEYMVRSFKSLEGIYAWEVKGDSMAPTLAGGSVVFVDTTQNTLPPDDIYAIDYGDGLVVKSIQLLGGTDKALIISDNPKYRPVEMQRESILVYGRVVGWFQWRK
ncbi:XRE family transcriptional regulator [Agrobacterium pusense]|uniref:XRE family transcriptional regulator n=1 Tax=Agrobacterium pusense TaxID=648995 RepID=UPI002FE0C5CA